MSVADASMASITSSSERASAWMSSRSMRRDERAVEALDDLVGQEVALVLDLLDLVGLVPVGTIGREHLLEQPRTDDQLVGHRQKIGVKLLFARNQAEKRHYAPRRPFGRQLNRGIVADPFTRPLQRGDRAMYDRASRCPPTTKSSRSSSAAARERRLFPLTQLRSKPAVPIGGKYRLIDIPISNCLHADIRRIFVLTQFNSASLNRHIAQTYRMDLVQPRLRRDPRGRADARQPELVPGDGRRRAAGRPPLRPLRRRLLPDPGRRSPLPHGLRGAGGRARRPQAPTSPSRRSRCRPTTRRRWASSASTATGRSSRSRRSRRPTRLAEIGRSIPHGATFGAHAPDKAVRRLDGDLRLLARRAARAARAPRRGSTSGARSSRRRSTTTA